MAKKSEETKAVMNGNYFELTGKITYVDVKHAQNGTAYTRVLMSKKSKKNDDTYDTYAFTFFGDTAEQIADTIKKGDFCNIVGNIEVDVFEKEGKKIETLRLIGRHFVKAKYDENEKGYVADEGEAMPWG